jgi:hypothetical protein
MNEAVSPLNDAEKQKARKRTPKDIGLLAVVPKSERGDQRQPAPEAHQLHGSDRAHEHLGHMLVSGEAKPTERSQRAVPETLEPASGKRIATLNRAELLTLSEKIIVDGSSLRQIYETHLIGERGLRRLIAEYVNGGDLKKALKREIVEREIDFERDPAMRDLALRDAPLNGSSATVTLDKLLKQAAVDVDDDGEEAAFFKARARYEITEQQHQFKRRRVIDISLAAIIALLIILVIFLLLRG